MANVAVYYNMNPGETREESIYLIENIIKNIEDKIIGVYIDQFGSSENFNKLISEDVNRLQYVYLNRKLDNEFDAQMIYELSKAADFRIIYFSEV